MSPSATGAKTIRLRSFQRRWRMPKLLLRGETTDAQRDITKRKSRRWAGSATAFYALLSRPPYPSAINWDLKQPRLKIGWLMGEPFTLIGVIAVPSALPPKPLKASCGPVLSCPGRGHNFVWPAWIDAPSWDYAVAADRRSSIEKSNSLRPVTLSIAPNNDQWLLRCQN